MCGSGCLCDAPGTCYEPDNSCDACGTEAELYHNEATGLAYCEECDLEAEANAEQRIVFRSICISLQVVVRSMDVPL